MKAEENDADINAKNTPDTTFKTHQAKHFGKRMKSQERIHNHKYQSTRRMLKIYYGSQHMIFFM